MGTTVLLPTSRLPTISPPPTSTSTSSGSSSRVCRYFSKSGSCRDGGDCQYSHDQTRAPGAPAVRDDLSEAGEASGSAEKMVSDHRQAVVQPSRAIVAKPIPQTQTQNPRDYQLGQIRRRFSPKESVQGQNTLLKFDLKPSDPDFPFEMTALECLLSIPPDYPKSRPSLKVGNKDIPRGFALNVEAGFDGLAQEKTSATLLELMKALDKNLEVFLSAPKAETIKLVLNRDVRHLANTPSTTVEPATGTAKTAVASQSSTSSHANVVPIQHVRSFTAEEKAEAAKRREMEVRQLEARMGRLPLFKKSSDKIAYTIPVEPRRRTELPVALQSIKLVELFVPLLYPLQTLRVKLLGVDSEDAKRVEKGFELKAAELKDVTLIAHVNYLAQNMHVLAKTVIEPEKKHIPVQVEPQVEIQETTEKGKATEGLQDPDRSHIQYITRPAEWTIVDLEDSSGDDTDGMYSYDTEGESSDAGEGGVQVEGQKGEAPKAPEPSQEKGTAISFPFIELYGIELLEIVVLNITVKCERCKDTTEIHGLKSETPKTASCKKCATQLSITFRKEFVHVNAVRAGFLDLEGCVVGDMLPSTFLPTCSQCSTTYPLPGIVSVQGSTSHNVCRECHQKFSFALPQVRFLRISSSHLPPASGPRRKKETLGLVAGTELPKKGRCRHYAKSYRWFRFSCCQKVYACDKCHDEVEEHPNEWANRIICGFCSREANYRPEDCGICHAVLIGKKGGGFWEGGKGTRDQTRMSRKDPRKHKRIRGAPKAAS